MSQHSLFEASAPGRLDVIGGIADYSGSLVLQMPIEQRTSVSVVLRDDYQCILRSTMSSGETVQEVIDYRELLSQGSVDYKYAANYFRIHPDKVWAAYSIGCALVLQKEKNISFKGAEIEITSQVPLGKGVSSSASLEVATMKALSNAFDLSFSGTELPILAQRVENLIVGAPCGLMDQLATYLGSSRKLLPIVCQPDKIQELIPIPDDVFFIGIDSGVRHSVGGASYGDVRCAAFMGYSIIAHSLGISASDIRAAKEHHNTASLPYQGYLSNISVVEFENRFQSILPASMGGKEFIDKYGHTIDTVTAVSPDKTYAIHNCTKHPVFENNRVHQFRDLLFKLNSSTSDRLLSVDKMGALMHQAHDSYSACGLGSQRTDEIVNLSRQYKGIYGAKITGGGSGGTVCLLAYQEEGRKSAKDLHQFLCNKYKEKLILFDSH